MASTKHAGEGEVTRTDTEKRVKRAEELLCLVHTSGEIVRMLCDEFKIVDRTAYTYVKLAYERLHVDDDAERGIRKARARAAWQAQYRRCIANSDWSAANYALDRMCKLDGLFAPTKHSVTVTASLSVQVQIRSIVGVLDATGLAALDVLMKQIEVAQAKGLLPAGDAPKPDPADAAIEELDDAPRPIAVTGAGRKKPKAKA